MNTKKYLITDPANRYPAGEEIYYECLVCGGILASMPQHSVACKCRNVIIDVDAGRVAVKDLSKFNAYVREPGSPISQPRSS